MSERSDYRAGASGIAYTRRGSGEPLVLLHGVGSSLRMWDSVIADVAACREVIAIDLPGFGRSPLGDTVMSVAGYVDAVSLLLAGLGIEHAHIAGHSFGGAIALEAGRRGTARSVVAFAPIGFWGAAGGAWAQWSLLRAHAASRRLAPVLPALAATAAGRTVAGGLFYGSPKDVPPQQFIEDAELFRNAPEFDPVCRSFADYVFTEPGSLLDIPVTIAWGSRDRLLPARSQARRARLALSRARHIRLGGVGHAIVTEDPVSCRLLLADRWR